ncbi:hypothetical protein F4781DRAFT_135861 [Annulohypoxylon bovei var. microspora]|nr:hypothetical protein F4781DRAFT_135861 [Annulohypoxylon bovei var. microspora]
MESLTMTDSDKNVGNTDMNRALPPTDPGLHPRTIAIHQGVNIEATRVLQTLQSMERDKALFWNDIVGDAEDYKKQSPFIIRTLAVAVQA